VDVVLTDWTNRKGKALSCEVGRGELKEDKEDFSPVVLCCVVLCCVLMSLGDD